jgi:hypothetical protein
LPPASAAYDLAAWIARGVIIAALEEREKGVAGRVDIDRAAKVHVDGPAKGLAEAVNQRMCREDGRFRKLCLEPFYTPLLSSAPRTAEMTADDARVLNIVVRVKSV